MLYPILPVCFGIDGIMPRCYLDNLDLTILTQFRSGKAIFELRKCNTICMFLENFLGSVK